MKIIIVILLSLSFTGCGWVNRQFAYLDGYAYECIAGVLYIQFPTGASVAYEVDGKVKSCDKNKPIY